MLRCYVFEGLANRINCIASAFLISPEIDLRWSRNKHCPVAFEDVFDSLDGCKVTNVSRQKFPYNVGVKDLCWFYVCNPKQVKKEEFAERMSEQYRFLVSKLKHQPEEKLADNSVGVCFRGLFPEGSGEGVDKFVPKLVLWLQQRNPDEVLVVADNDSSKTKIISEIEQLGLKSVTISCPLLSSDLNRSPANVFGMSKELVLLSQCKEVISNSMRSSIPDSTRGFGCIVTRTFDSGQDLRDQEIEGWLDEYSRQKPKHVKSTSSVEQ